MVQRPGGLEPHQMQEAATALARASSVEAITHLVDTMLAFQSPVFHAELKSQYDSFRERRHPNLERMRPPYGNLFLELHYRIHEKNVIAAREAGPPASKPELPSPYAPPFFAALRDAFVDELPAERGPAHLLDTGLHALREEVAAHTKDAVVLPYEPTRGSRWTALLVRCAVCDTPRIDVRAYRVDLVVAPELEAPMREGRINQAVCPNCGSDVCYPRRTIAIDPPGARDDLAELTCAWRVTPRMIIYQPTPGTQRHEQNDVVLQVRFEWLLEAEPWEQEEPGASRAVAYSTQEFFELLERATEDDGTIPVAMGTLLEQLRRDVAAGMLSLSEAREVLFSEAAAVGRDWPLLDPGPAQRTDDSLAHLLECWITEGVAQAQGIDPARRIQLAHQTTWSLMAMGKLGLAEAALALGEDLLAQLEAGEVQKQCTMLLGSLRAELLETQGRPEEALALRRELDLEAAIQGDSWQARFARLAINARDAQLLWQTAEFEAAFQAFQQAIGGMGALLQEGTEGTDDEIRGHLPELKHGLSGALANFGGLLQDLLERGGLDDPDSVAMKAEDALRNALELSLGVDGFKFAGIQAHRLAALLAYRGQDDEAEKVMYQAIGYAARAGDHVRVGTGHEFLARRALERHEGETALEHLTEATREIIRHEVGLGFTPTRVRANQDLSLAALSAIDAGGDPLRAVAIVESLRAANTAAAIATGTPFRATALPGEIRELIRAREELRLRLTWEDDPEMRSRLDQVVRDLAEARRRLAVRDPRYARWVDASDQDVADSGAIPRRLEQLGPNALWLGVVEGPNELWSYSVRKDVRLERVPRPVDRSLDTIAGAVLAPHADRLASLGPDDVLVVSVEGAMASVPFAALPLEQGPLVGTARIVTTLGLGMLASALDRPAAPLDSFLLLGGPQRPELDPLPGATKEAKRIAQVVEGTVTTLVGAAATVGALEQWAPEHTVLHFSCHAVADPAAERGSRLMLSPEPLRNDSGVLTEERILTELEVRPGGLVNLAGCATGRLAESDAPLLGGLVPTFLVAGARSVIASRWSIADEPSARLQEEFYRSLAEGEGAAAALAATQRRCIAGELGDGMRDPEVWAAYAVYGAGV